MTAAAFKAVYADWKLIKTRQCVQVIFEVPIEAANQAYQVLGGMPNFGESAWFGIARLNAESEVMQNKPGLAEKPTGIPANKIPPRQAHSSGGAKSWHEMAPSQQAGILCGDKSFHKFLHEYHGLDFKDGNEVAFLVRNMCRVKSRKDISPSNTYWKSLVSEYRSWMREPEII